MKPHATWRHAAKMGFTLIEVVLSLGIVATALIALMGLIPVALDTSRTATNHTLVSTIMEDVYYRLQGTPLVNGEPSICPLWYDLQGKYLPPSTTPEDLQKLRTYRVEVLISDWDAAPAHTSDLRVATVTLYSALNQDGEPSPNASSQTRTVITFPLGSLTGKDWPFIDSNYVPKIEL